MDYSVKEGTIEHIFGKVVNFILPSKDNGYRSRFLQSNVLLYFVLLLVVLKIFTFSIPINFPQNIALADITNSVLENFANQTRQSLGLKPLSVNEKLNQAALLKAENMVQNQYFSHTSPGGVTPWFWFLKAGYNYKYAGENLAVGFYDSKEVYDAWLNSPSHKANIVNPNYTEVGTAVLGGFGQNNSIIVVQEFGTQLVVKQPASGVPTKGKISTVPATQESVPNNKKVLSQSTESEISIEPARGNAVNNYSSRLMNYVLYNLDKLLQNIAYGASLIIIGIMMLLIFFNFKISFKRNLVLRSVLIVVLLSAATLINKDVIMLFIPHQIFI
jgi:hypothetical protein